MAELKTAIDDYIKHNNAHPKPFIWTKSAQDIILKVNGESIDNQRLPDIIKKIGGKLGTEVKLRVRHLTGEDGIP